MDIKLDFFNYIGPKEKVESNKYQRSYKLVFLLCLLQNIDNDGKASAEKIGHDFAQFYKKRKEQGLLPEKEADDVIANIQEASAKRIMNHIKKMPYDVIHKAGFVSIKMIDDIEYFYLQKELFEALSIEDKYRLSNIIENKINIYFNKIDMENDKLKNNFDTFDINETISIIYAYIQSKGLFYEESLIQNIYLSLKSKPFLILAGTSGTGKSKLVRLFAESLGATSENGRYKLIPVKSDWSDSTDLLGYKDLSGTFHPGSLTKVLYEAKQNPEQPYFICLDEMNLARVEYYLSDLLSLMETRKKVGEEIKTDLLFSEDAFGNDSKSLEKYKQLYIPQNVYIIGTVNMDETTFPFSKKVLDRANTIEFSDVELSYDFDDILQEEIEPALLHNDFLKSEYLILKDCEAHRDVVQQTIEILKKINEILKEVNLHFGFRIRDEICYYRVYNEKFSIMKQDQAMDFQILQKILPRIQGSSSGIKRALIQLYILCANIQSKGLDEGNIGVFEEMLALWKQQSASMPYPRAAQKIAFMMRRYEEDGFTSYWL